MLSLGLLTYHPAVFVCSFSSPLHLYFFAMNHHFVGIDHEQQIAVFVYEMGVMRQ